MKAIDRNKIIIFMLYLLSNILLGMVLLTVVNYQTVGLIVMFFSLVIGSIIFFSDFYNGLKIGVYFFIVSLSVFFGYLFHTVVSNLLHLDFTVALFISFVMTLSMNIVITLLHIQSKMIKSIYDFFKQIHQNDCVDYKRYRKYCIEEWFSMQKKWISNQTNGMTLMRIIILISFGTLGIYGFFNDTFQVFSDHLIYDKMIFAFLTIFAITYFILGFRFSAKFTFYASISLIAFYYIRLSVYKFSIENIEHALIFNFILALSFVSAAVFFLFWLKNELYYSNVQMYEREGRCITVDLFVHDIMPVNSLKTLMKFSIPMGDFKSNPKAFTALLKYFIRQSHKYKSIFAGYTTDFEFNRLTCYLYTYPEKAYLLKEAFKVKIRRTQYHIEDITCESDPEWNIYENQLYPNKAELCSIASRNYIEELFMKGTSFDKEYDIGFFINFKDKADPVDFEKKVQYFGLKLAYASYEEKECDEHEYRYCGEYKIKSYITPRRIEYFNQLLLDKTDEYGALYVGGWQVES